MNTSKANLQPSATVSSSTSREQDGCAVGVSKQEQKSLAGVVLIVIRRRVTATCPHSEAPTGINTNGGDPVRY